ncbi:MAG TPA: hypothetical protein VE987_17185 [Polyangiaceae bacterium]|nr:hypothetical protein [Polyangiaceae bacterium]
MTKEDMLRLMVKVMKGAKVKMGIGGGIAVAAHGFRRDTVDVDAFFHYGDRQKVLRALRTVAPDFAVEPIADSHWIAVAPDAAPDERIDLMFATGDPEESAIELAEMKRYKGVDAPMFPVDLLVACKYLADREDPKDWLDIYALHQRGAYDVADVVKRLRQMGLAKDARAFVEFMKKLEEVSKQKRRR